MTGRHHRSILNEPALVRGQWLFGALSRLVYVVLPSPRPTRLDDLYVFHNCTLPAADYDPMLF
jgi:hypothetical protein